MVQFPRFRLAVPTDRDVERLTALRVTPFGHPRISGCLLLLAAFRSLPRPSSPSSSKASTVDPCPLAISPISPSLCPTTAVKDPVDQRRHRRRAGVQRHPRASVKDPSSGRRANGNPLGRPFDVHLESGLAFRRECSTRRGVEVWGLEPQTYGLQSHRSSHLSYTPGARQNRSASVTTKREWEERGWSPPVTADRRKRRLLKKEVIQPHLPVRLPCYDFTPLTRHTFGVAVLAVRQTTSGTPNSGGMTGGVYKARERIHRAMLMRDY